MGRMVNAKEQSILRIALASVRLWERDAIGRRTSAGMRRKIARGEYTGGAVPYGYRLAADGERLAPVRAEQAVVTQAREMRSAGLSFREMAAVLSRRGVRNREGHKFDAPRLCRMLQRSAK